MERSFPPAEVKHKCSQLQPKVMMSQVENGQDSSQAVTVGMGVNGLTQSFVFEILQTKQEIYMIVYCTFRYLI